jgi:RimJ/RimL family protein N-acetyltransferase
MLKAVYFFINDVFSRGEYGSVPGEVKRAVCALRAGGLDSGILPAEDFPFRLQEAVSIQPENTLILCDSGERIRTLQKMGFCAAGYSHAGNRSEQFRGVSYIIQEPDLVDFDSYEKIYERGAGLPWTILKTRRCLVREFTVDDLEGIYSLYDDRARMFLEPPSEDRAHEREILQAYIERIYGLYGFGHWAVLTTDPAAPGTMDPLAPGTLIGRIGFSAVTADKEAQAAALGVSGIDADFGFLVAASCRGTGIAQEVCEALLRYGFECLGFLRVSADADPRNGASIRLLQKLGFTAVGRSDGKIFFIRDA